MSPRATPPSKRGGSRGKGRVKAAVRPPGTEGLFRSGMNPRSPNLRGVILDRKGRRPPSRGARVTISHPALHGGGPRTSAMVADAVRPTLPRTRRAFSNHATSCRVVETFPMGGTGSRPVRTGNGSDENRTRGIRTVAPDAPSPVRFSRAIRLSTPAPGKTWNGPDWSITAFILRHRDFGDQSHACVLTDSGDSCQRRGLIRERPGQGNHRPVRSSQPKSIGCVGTRE